MLPANLRAGPFAPGVEEMNAGVKLGRDVLVALGRELRTMYAHVVSEATPGRFAEILRRLDVAMAQRETSGRRFK
jgi:Anti-sigma factor NepR